MYMQIDLDHLERIGDRRLYPADETLRRPFADIAIDGACCTARDPEKLRQLACTLTAMAYELEREIQKSRAPVLA